MDHSPATPSTTPRHLKRLSLNTSSPFSPASPSSPLSKSTTSPANQINGTPSPLVRNDSGRRTRSLRLSTSNAPASSSSSPISATSTTATENQPFSSPIPHESAMNGSSSLDSPTPRTRSTTTTPRSAHARRTSSISYSKSPTIGTLSSGGGGGGQAESTAFSPARGSPNLSHSIRGNSFESGRPRPSLDGLAESREEEEESAAEAHGEVGTESVRTSVEEEGKKAEEPINLASGSALGFVNAQATLTEQNADLLSFIAKKERKCLDLREELKRHETELALLKKKWESIVARSFQQQQQQTTPRHNPSQSVSTVSSASPNTSPTPRSASLHPLSSNPSHSLDLSLLSNTFDASELLSSSDSRQRSTSGSDPQIEIPESVKAAGNWLGGALGRVLEAAVGMPPPSEAPDVLEGRRREREGGHGGLESLREEEEEDQEEDAKVSGDRRRESQASSTETESTSGSAEKESTAASSVQEDEQSSATQIKNSPLRRKPVQERSASPLSSRKLFTSPPPAPSSSSTSTNTFPPPASSASSTTSPSHNRTRSSLSSFSDSWSSLNKRWTNLTESETFKNSKRATLGLVDTFEQGLAQALGPLEPPSLGSPSMSRDNSSGGGERRGSSTTIPSPFLGASTGSSSNGGNSPNPNEVNDRRLTEVPISPMPGQALSSVFASWSKGKEKEKEKERREEKGKGKAKDNGFDWSAFQDEDKKDHEEEVEEWPAW